MGEDETLYPTKKGITIIRRMINIDRRDEENKAHPKFCVGGAPPPGSTGGPDSYARLTMAIWGESLSARSLKAQEEMKEMNRVFQEYEDGLIFRCLKDD